MSKIINIKKRDSEIHGTVYELIKWDNRKLCDVERLSRDQIITVNLMGTNIALKFKGPSNNRLNIIIHPEDKDNITIKGLFGSSTEITNNSTSTSIISINKPEYFELLYNKQHLLFFDYFTTHSYEILYSFDRVDIRYLNLYSV